MDLTCLAPAEPLPPKEEEGCAAPKAGTSRHAAERAAEQARQVQHATVAAEGPLALSHMGLPLHAEDIWPAQGRVQRKSQIAEDWPCVQVNGITEGACHSGQRGERACRAAGGR